MLLKPVIVIINLVDIVFRQHLRINGPQRTHTPGTSDIEFSGMKGSQQVHAYGRKWLPPAQDKGLLLDPS